MDGEFDVYLQELKPFVKSAEQSKDADKKKNENKSKDKEKSEKKDKDKDKAAEGTDSEDSSKAAETPKPQEEGKPTVASSELITYKSLQESAKAHNNEKPRNLPLRLLRTQFHKYACMHDPFCFAIY